MCTARRGALYNGAVGTTAWTATVCHVPTASWSTSPLGTLSAPAAAAAAAATTTTAAAATTTAAAAATTTTLPPPPDQYDVLSAPHGVPRQPPVLAAGCDDIPGYDDVTGYDDDVTT